MHYIVLFLNCLVLIAIELDSLYIEDNDIYLLALCIQFINFLYHSMYHQWWSLLLIFTESVHGREWHFLLVLCTIYEFFIAFNVGSNHNLRSTLMSQSFIWNKRANTPLLLFSLLILSPPLQLQSITCFLHGLCEPHPGSHQSFMGLHC